MSLRMTRVAPRDFGTLLQGRQSRLPEEDHAT